MKCQIKIDGKTIGSGNSPYVIAEMSANHNGKIENAFKIIELAKKAGADAVKIQTYTADTITIKSDLPEFKITSGLWAGRTLYELYDWAHTPWDWHEQLFEHAKKVGITMFSSPFDNTAVNLLECLNTPVYKIASFEAIDIPLVKYVASTGKPMIISTGMASFEEIQEAVDAARSHGCTELALLHCVSGYPAPASDYNLLTIQDLINQFRTVVGLSDHTIENTTAIASVALGASIIEKHFTLDRNGGGPDDSFSLESNELANLCAGVKSTWAALGSVDYSCKTSEKENIKYRRSLYFVRDVPLGAEITESDIRSIRPGFGLSPKYYSEILGKRLMVSVHAGTPVKWAQISGERG